jgi:deazaflavin-dependent oxidoreductase (nitroreductase family)
MSNDFNQKIIDEFRANAGRVGGAFEGGRLLLLTTVGARSGAPHTTPLGYLPDGDRVLVIASAGGSARHPAWFHNLLAEPQATVEVGPFSYEARAEVLENGERTTMFDRAIELDPGWADYQNGTTRTLPVVALHQIAGGPPKAATLGAALVLIHDAFRLELSRIRREVAASGPGLGAQLRVNCLTVCQGLAHHHAGEDSGVFPMLARRQPGLAPVLDRLGREHEQVAVLLAELRAAVAADRDDPARVATDVERLVTALEAHLRYEEAELIPVLDGIGG